MPRDTRKSPTQLSMLADVRVSSIQPKGLIGKLIASFQ